MNIISLWARVREGHYEINLDIEAPYLPKDYVFDENITIAENRRRIEAENHKIQYKRLELYHEQDKLDSEFTSELFKFLVSTFELSVEQANSCIDWAFNEAGDTDKEKRFSYFVKAVSFLSVFLNKPVAGLDRVYC